MEQQQCTLNIYIGLRAIGYVITSGNNIVKYGVKRVNISHSDYYEYVAGLPVSKRINRRLKAQARRNRWRYRSRRENLRRLLLRTFGCHPQHLSREENLRLRVKGLSQKLTPQELVNVLFQLQRKRGYKAVVGANESEDSDYLKQIDIHEENLRQYPSIAAYLLTMDSSKNVIFRRKSYEKEFRDIMAAQELDDRVVNALYNIIYYQRPIKRRRIGVCKYERNRKVTHASNPLYQEFRVLRDVLNITIYDKDKNELEIPLSMRLKWAERCNKGANITKASCLKDIGIKSSSEYTWYSGKAIAGNPIYKALSIAGDIDHHILWQEIYSATDEEKLRAMLANKYKLPPAVINELVDLDMHKLGWADISVKAIRKLLPLMRKGMTMKDAVMQVYGAVDFTTVHLRNVVLEQHYYACQSLYDALCKRYNIVECKFEIDYMLKAGNKARKALASARRKRQKTKDQYKDLSEYELLKLALWQESGGISPYEPDVHIEMHDLFSDKYNIDHIVPKSKLFEMSMDNLVLCRAELNEKKDRMTGYDFAKHLGILDRYIEVASIFHESKQQLLMMSEDEIPSDWISRRQNSDYNTKCFASLFKCAVNIPNKLINHFIKWTEYFHEDDARCYLARAWVLGNMSQDTIQFYDNIKSVALSDISVYDAEPHLPQIDYNNVVVAMPKVKFSRKIVQRSGKVCYASRFQLHDESIYGMRTIRRRDATGKIIEDVFYKIRQPISKLSPAMVGRIMDKALREKIMERIASAASHEQGIASLVDTPILHNGKPVYRVSVRYNSNVMFPLHSTNGNGLTAPLGRYDRKIDYVMSSKHYCLKVHIDENGKVIREVIPMMQYIKALNNNERLDRGFYLMENDIIELDGQYYYLVGVTMTPTMRPIYRLSAKDEIKIKAQHWRNIRRVLINQLGDIISKQAIPQYENCK